MATVRISGAALCPTLQHRNCCQASITALYIYLPCWISLGGATLSLLLLAYQYYAAASLMWNLFHECRSVPVLHQLAYIKPNSAELAAIAEAVLQQQPGRRWLLQDQGRPCSCRCSACRSSSSSGGTMAGTARAQDDCSTSGESAAALPQALQLLLPQAAVLLTAGELPPSHNRLR